MKLMATTYRFRMMILFLVVLPVCDSLAQIIDPQNVLIKNVYIVSAESKEDDSPVNVLVRDNKLEIITRDEVKLEDGTMTVDGDGGFLLGTLKVGETPSFFILDEDPTKDFDVLIDSAPHVVFAVDDGKLVKNRLFEVQKSAQELAQDATTSGWIAYMPPPLALPTRKRNTLTAFFSQPCCWTGSSGGHRTATANNKSAILAWRKVVKFVAFDLAPLAL